MALKDYKFGYTPVKDKQAFLKGWPNNPYTLSEVTSMIANGQSPSNVKPNGFGLVSGIASGGIACLDLDGPEAFDFVEQNFGLRVLESANFVWSSGRPQRMQIGWQIGEQYWDLLEKKTFGEGNKLEFRWDGSQSVMPPSVHPKNESGYYIWLIEPNGEPIAEMPQALLEFWLKECQSKAPDDDFNLHVEVNDSEWFIKKVFKIVEIIRRADGVPGYDGDLGWRAIGHAVASAVGVEQAKNIMMRLYPPKNTTEYRTLYSSYSASASPKFGRLCTRAIQIDPDAVRAINKEAYQGVLKTMSPKERMKQKYLLRQAAAERYANFNKWRKNNG